MPRWPDTRAMDLLGLDVPVIQAPMSGVGYADMAVAVCRAGGLGSLGAASLAPDTLRAEAAAVRAGTNRAWNVNFFCHQPPRAMAAQDALWGGYSLVDAELRGMALLLAMDGGWSHYINLSGQDFPLKSQEYIRQFFAANPGKQFIRALDQRKERPDTMNRISHMFTEGGGVVAATGIARSYLAGDTPFIGTQWKAVTRSFCEYVCHDPRADRFKTFYRDSFIADEAFFQTVIMNSGDQGMVMNDDLRMIDWVPDGDIKLRPRDYDVADIEQLRRSPDLFARKFNAENDPEVMTLLERHLRTPEASIYLKPAQVPGSGPSLSRSLPVAA